MQQLTDCQILEYCHSTPEERESEFQRAAENDYKPVYQMPVFELCHTLHLLVKHYDVSPSHFRGSYAGFCDKHLGIGEYFIHVPEDHPEDMVVKLLRMPHKLPEDGFAPCGDPEIYWGHNKHLIYRLKSLTAASIEELSGWWEANPPEGNSEPPLPKGAESQDVVLDTNNFLELLNQLPANGFTSVADIRLPTRLSEDAREKIQKIVDSYGAIGKFIIPLSVLEEAEWVANRRDNFEKYENVRKVLHSIRMQKENPLWNIFSFEAINQEIFEYFLFLYERLEAAKVNFDDFDDFGDLLVLAHGLYHGCKIASNEWFEGKPDVWDLAKGFFPFLVVDR